MNKSYSIGAIALAVLAGCSQVIQRVEPDAAVEAWVTTADRSSLFEKRNSIGFRPGARPLENPLSA
ncbi:MAG TPA: hypothetical protein VEB86_14170 [Chryseosolibacter sp.]|nr:hypothetical protein [Chryseosolibacter sp.]